MLEINELVVGYNESLIVQGASLSVGDGSIVALLGRNGVGKTTLLRGVGGLTPARSGGVVLNGQDITRLEPHQIARRGVRLVPQGRRLFPSLSVLEHLAIGATSRVSNLWNIDKVLELFPILRERSHHVGTNLSGGEQSMLACGRALVGNPESLLMDEPTEGLAPLMVREIERVIGLLKAAGTSILLVEQNLAFALRVADIIYIMSKGRIVHECKPDDLRDDKDLKARYLGV